MLITKKFKAFKAPLPQSLLTFLFLAPSAFFSFQDLHDGYVIQTALMFENFVAGSSFVPFSQYGPLWSLVLGLVSLMSSPDLLLISIRFFSIFCYSASMYLLFGIVQLLTKKMPSPIINFFFISSWYFFGPYHGWPSTFVLPLSLTCFAIFSDLMLNSQKWRAKALFIGSLVALIQFGRLQVGFLLLFAFIFLFLFFGLKRYVYFLLIGYSIVVAITFFTLNTQRVLYDSLYDLVIFPYGFHLSAERGATRIPIWTILIALFVLAAIRLDKTFFDSSLRKVFRFTIYFLLTTSTLIVICDLMIPSDISYWLRWRLLQRLYVGIFLGLLLSCLLEFGLILRSAKKKSLLCIRVDQINFGLSVLALAVYSQNYPLFSSHHTWYSSLPILLVSYILLREKLENPNNPRHKKGNSLVITLLVSTIGIWTINHSINAVRAPFEQIVWVSQEESVKYSAVKEFLDKNVERGSSLHNFCTTPIVFVIRPDVTPASRIFLWWEHFEDFSQYRIAAKKKAEFALVCGERLTVFDSLFNSANWTQKATLEGVNLSLYKRVPELIILSNTND
jgi:hypothetical protein